jgi:hypothetical protein
LMVLAALIGIGFLEDRFGLQTRVLTFELTVPAHTDVLVPAHRIAEEAKIEARRWQTHKTDDGSVVDFEAEVTHPQERHLLTKFAELNAKVEVRPVRS